MNPSCFLLVTGLPRSGTTVLAAVLDAHSAIELFYEPFNAHQKAPPSMPRNVSTFRSQMRELYRMSMSSNPAVTGFKETSITPGALDWAEQMLAIAAKELPVKVLWIVRDPVHTYFSRLDGARKWWGRPNARFTSTGFRDFLQRSAQSVRRLRAILEGYQRVLISYEALVENPNELLRETMEWLGLEVEIGQLAYYEKGPQLGKVMGDVGVATEPRSLGDASVHLREKEAKAHADAISKILAEREPSELVRFCTSARLDRFVRQP